MEFYANAVAEALVRNGLVKDAGHRLRTQILRPTPAELEAAASPIRR
jgi:hypothetical protein